MSIKDRMDAAGKDETGVAVVKATNHDFVVPKPKHVRSLVEGTRSRSVDIKGLTTELNKRLGHQDWIVVIKSLLLTHNLLKEDNSAMHEQFRQNLHTSHLQSFNDLNDPRAFEMCQFVRVYSRYVDEKICSFARNVRYGGLAGGISSHVQGQSTDDVVNVAGRLQNTLKVLLQTHVGQFRNELDVFLVAAMSRIVPDTCRVYRALNDAVVVLLERFFDLDAAAARPVVEVYELFVKQTESVIAMLRFAQQISSGSISVPELSHAPNDLLEAMRNHVAGTGTSFTPKAAEDDLPPTQAISFSANATTAPRVVAAEPVPILAAPAAQAPPAAASGGFDLLGMATAAPVAVSVAPPSNSPFAPAPQAVAAAPVAQHAVPVAQPDLFGAAAAAPVAVQGGGAQPSWDSMMASISQVSAHPAPAAQPSPFFGAAPVAVAPAPVAAAPATQNPFAAATVTSSPAKVSPFAPANGAAHSRAPSTTSPFANGAATYGGASANGIFATNQQGVPQPQSQASKPDQFGDLFAQMRRQ